MSQYRNVSKWTDGAKRNRGKRERDESPIQLALKRCCSEALHCSKMDPSTKSCNNETMAAHVPRSCTSESVSNQVQLNELETVFTRTF